MVRNHFFVLAAVVGGIFVVRHAVAMTLTSTVQQGTVTFAAGGVTGPVGYQSGAGGTGGTAYGVYGHSVAGQSCTGSDNKTQNNNLEVSCQWVDGDGNSKTINATAQLRNKTYSEVLVAIDCPQGPPSWTGVATTTINTPVIGTSGGTTVAGAWTVNLGGGNTSGPIQGASMSPYAWTIDPANADTQLKIVSTKVVSSLNGTVVEDQVTSVSNALAKLVVTVN